MAYSPHIDFSALLPETLKHLERLHRLLKFFTSIPYYSPTPYGKPGRGFIKSTMYYGIFWPDLAHQRKQVDRLNILTFDHPEGAIREALKKGFKHSDLPPVGLPRNAWELSVIRAKLEKWFAPLIHSSSIKAPNYFSDKAELAIFHYTRLQRKFADKFERYELDTSLFLDVIDNYTVMVPLEVTLEAIYRTCFVTPPLFGMIKDDFADVPRPLQLLYQAWFLLINRGEAPFKPSVVGVDFTPQGYILINWDVFLNNPQVKLMEPSPAAVAFKDKTVKTASQTSKAEVHMSQALAELKSIRLKHAIPIPLPYKRIQPVNPSRQSRNSLYTKTCERTFDSILSDPDGIPPCTIIDPYCLNRLDHLFSGYHHRTFRENAKIAAAKRYQELKKVHPTRQPVACASVYTFDFRPYTYLHAAKKQCPDLDISWLPDNYVEPIYATKYFKELSFMRPHFLKRTTQECAGDVEVWLRTLDSINIIQHFYEDAGSFIDFGGQLKTRSEYWKRQKEKELLRAAKHLFTDVVTLSGLPPSKLQAIEAYARKQYLENNQEAVGSLNPREWWRHAQQKYRTLITPTALRRKAFVLLPGQETLTENVFYKSLALKLFNHAAAISLGFAKADCMDDLHAQMYDFEYNRAPYLYAWSQFCLECTQKGIGYAKARTNPFAPSKPPVSSSMPKYTRWTPTEDCVLLQHYSCYDNRNDKGWDTLVKLLPGRSRISVTARLQTIRRVLKKALKAPSYRKWMLSGRPLNMLEAKRLTFFIGCSHVAKTQGVALHPMHCVVHEIYSLPDEFVAQFELPPVYTYHVYAKFFASAS